MSKVVIPLLVLLVVGCVRLPDVAPPPTSPADAAHGQEVAEIPGGPTVRELDTRRAYVVRLGETGGSGPPGRLRVFSSEPGAAVLIDGQEHISLPLNIDIAPGRHTVVATCPDGTVESREVTVEPEATVHVRVCGRVMEP